MKTKKKQLHPAVIILLAILGLALIAAAVIGVCKMIDSNRKYGFHQEVPQQEYERRMALVQAAEEWLGMKESDGSHQQIIDLYNSHEPLAQNYLVQYDDQWCATFVSASAIKAGLTHMIPTECGCQRQIDLFKDLDCWQEDDAYLPLPGDIIYYCRTNKDLTGDCTGWSDHVGIVVGTNGNKIKVIEGNYGDQVGYRYIKKDATIIRGYGVPDYTLTSQ